MTHKLTKLQCLGISTLLCNIYNHDSNWLERGYIKFKLNPKAYWINMFVYTHDKNICYQFTLEWDECIDDLIEYEFEYDNRTKTFHIYENEMVVGES